MLPLAILIFFLSVLFALFIKLYKSITSPSVLLSAEFILACFFAMVGNLNWKVDINPLICIVIPFSIICLATGEYIGRRITVGNNLYNRQQEVKKEKVDIKRWQCFIVFIVLLLFVYLYIQEQISLARSVGYSGSSLFRWIRYGHHFNYVDNSTFIKICISVIDATSLIFLYFFIYNTVVIDKKIKKCNFRYLLPLIPFILRQVFSGARSGFILLAAFIFISISILIERKQRIKIFRACIIALFLLVIFLIIFTQLGKLTDKTNDSNIFENIYIYVGSSIVAFSEFISNYKVPTLSGEETFTGFLNLISELIGKQSISFSLEYTYFANGSSTNIYTAFRSYINDFGYIGLFLIQFIIGILFGCWDNYNKKSYKVNGISIILYSLYSYYLILSLFTPTLTSSFLTVGRISNFVLIIFIYRIFTVKHKRRMLNYAAIARS